MSELIHKSSGRFCRSHFLTTASVSAIIGLGCFGVANASDAAADRPSVWIEVGGQLDHLGAQSEPYVPPFADVASQHGLISPLAVQKASNYAFGEEGKITIQPEGASWTFSASVRYGRSSTKKHQHQEIAIPSVYIGPYTNIEVAGPAGQAIPRTADYGARTGESHLILDFRAGKDVGLGALTHHSSSHLDFGVRFAQFTSKSHLDLLADPDPHLASKYFPPFQRSLPIIMYYQFYKAHPDTTRSFHGLGPSLAWSGSVPLFDRTDSDAEVTLDLGANLSVLVGRQKTRIQHHTAADRIKHNPFGNPKYVHDTYSDYRVTSRSRSVVVPNVGGLAGISLKFPNAKVSMGYRADFFFGAMDGGIDIRRTYDRDFYGPFATISIGLGG